MPAADWGNGEKLVLARRIEANARKLDRLQSTVTELNVKVAVLIDRAEREKSTAIKWAGAVAAAVSALVAALLSGVKPQ
tara:strand:+ start:55 stop:291 length:237 start_codon:yes stop_codon:yes gene_type:complete